MLGAAQIMSFIATAKPDEALRFYRDVLGLKFIEDTPFAKVFDANGIMLRIVPVPNHKPSEFTVLGWEVADIADSVTALAKKGVAFHRYPGMNQDASGIWTAPDGNRVAWFKDPDGNVLSLTQFK